MAAICQLRQTHSEGRAYFDRRVAEGKTNKEIAADVFLSDKTVKNYVSSILGKLNLQRRAQAAAFVAKHRR